MPDEGDVFRVHARIQAADVGDEEVGEAVFQRRAERVQLAQGGKHFVRDFVQIAEGDANFDRIALRVFPAAFAAEGVVWLALVAAARLGVQRLQCRRRVVAFCNVEEQKAVLRQYAQAVQAMVGKRKRVILREAAGGDVHAVRE